MEWHIDVKILYKAISYYEADCVYPHEWWSFGTSHNEVFEVVSWYDSSRTKLVII